jgi:hypothetical protein
MAAAPVRVPFVPAAVVVNVVAVAVVEEEWVVVVGLAGAWARMGCSSSSRRLLLRAPTRSMGTPRPMAVLRASCPGMAGACMGMVPSLSSKCSPSSLMACRCLLLQPCLALRWARRAAARVLAGGACWT